LAGSELLLAYLERELADPAKSVLSFGQYVARASIISKGRLKNDLKVEAWAFCTVVVLVDRARDAWS